MPHGHITSISVLRDYRKLGIATKLMRACHNSMKTVYKARYVSLHVRVTNRAALTLYRDVLGYEIDQIAEEYYADKEDAYDMKLFFDKEARNIVMKKMIPNYLEEEIKKEETPAGGCCAVKSCQTEKPKPKGSHAAAQESASNNAAAAQDGAATEDGQKKKKKRKKN